MRSDRNHGSRLVMWVAATAGAFLAASAYAGELRFGAETFVDFGAGSGEPFINSSDEGEIFISVPFGLSNTVSILWKSIDGGRTYIPLGTPIHRDSVIGGGGGDSHQDFDANGLLYFVDLSGACVTAAVSLDGGNTFPPERTNQMVCASVQSPGALGDDRQWVGAFGDGIAYVTFRNLATTGFWMFKTSDGGLSWDGGRQLGTVSQSGPFQVDKTKRRIAVTQGGQPREGDAILSYQIFHRNSTNLRVFRVVDFDDGTPLVVNDLAISDTPGNKANVFPVLAVDVDGNLYAAWSQGASNIFMAASTDFGQTWSQPVQVNTTSGTNIMPWIVAGDAGRVNIVWYNSTMPGNPNNQANLWDIRLAQSLNALDAQPAFDSVKVNKTTIHRGQICLSGLACDLSGADRSFLEFPSVIIDPQGAAVVTYNANTNQVPVNYVMSARQVGGPSLFTAVGQIDSDPGAVSVESPLPGEEITETEAFVVLGTHSLPPANFDLDEAGDARFPDHGPMIGANVPALDIRAVHVAEDGDALVFTMELADLSNLAAAPLQVGGDGVAFVVQWAYENGDIHWAGAQVRAGSPQFLKGIVGAISNTAPKYYTFRFQPLASLAMSGNIAGNSVILRVPRDVIGNPEDGDRLYSVTAYTLSQRGPFSPDFAILTERDIPSLPIQVDAAGAFPYVIGEGARRAGVVEVSIDDPEFSEPVLATILNPTEQDRRWQVSLGAVNPGAHTLYVRQRIENRPASAPRAVAFVVPGGVDPFSFAPVRRVAPDTLIESAVVTLTGLSPGTEFSVSGASARLLVNDSGAWLRSGTLNPGDRVRLRVRSASSFDTNSVARLTVAGVTERFVVTTRSAIAPLPFVFAAVSSAPPDRVVVSEPVTISGSGGPWPVRVQGATARYSVNGGSFTRDEGTLVEGDVVQVRIRSSATPGETVSATLHIGDESASFEVTTREP
jgi:hypothetical protein